MLLKYGGENAHNEKLETDLRRKSKSFINLFIKVRKLT